MKVWCNCAQTTLMNKTLRHTDQGDASSSDWLDRKGIRGIRLEHWIPHQSAFRLLTTTPPCLPLPVLKPTPIHCGIRWIITRPILNTEHSTSMGDTKGRLARGSILATTPPTPSEEVSWDTRPTNRWVKVPDQIEASDTFSIDRRVYEVWSNSSGWNGIRRPQVA